MIELDGGALNDKPSCLPFRRTATKLNTSMGDYQINFICKDNAVTALDHWRRSATILLFARNYPL
jgi:hypothetical protein